MPAENFRPGGIGFVSRSGTLTYEIADLLSQAGLGQSTCIGIGGDPVIGLPTPDAVRLLNEDPATQAILIVGEIGGEGRRGPPHEITVLRPKAPRGVLPRVAAA